MRLAVRDAFGKPFELEKPARRIVSLIPNITEALFSLEAGDRVVGVSTFCAEPPDGVATKTKLGGQKNPQAGAIVALEPSDARGHTASRLWSSVKGVTNRIYRIDDGRAVRERQRALPTGTVVEAWLDVFQPGVVWVSDTTKRLLDEAGPPLTPGAAVDSGGISIFYPGDPQDAASLPSEESLRVRVAAGHGIAVT